MENFLGFARFIMYDSVDIAILHVMANEAEEKYIKRMEKKGLKVD
jgi:hypothetical protein